MSSNQQILSDLRVVLETGHALELMNTFKGVPFVCKAHVTSIEGDIVSLEAHHPSLVCLTRDKQTKVLGSDYFEPSVAQIVSVDLACDRVVLTKFAYLGTHLGERMIVRVEPKSPVPVSLELDDQVLPADLADLSMNGIGVRFPSDQYNPVLKPGVNLQVRLDLPKGQIQTDGTVLSTARLGDSYRISIRFAANHIHRVAIFHYLVDRRGEIEEELKQEYERMLHEQSA
jgi:hypothetical protein